MTKSQVYLIGISTGLLGGAIVSILSGADWFLNIGQVVVGIGLVLYVNYVPDTDNDEAV